MAHVREVIRNLSGKYQTLLTENENIVFFQGSARFSSPHELEIGDRRITSGAFVLATGASPRIPALPGLKDVPFLTYITALELEKLPASVLVLGGRAVALEFAQIFSRFGSKVCLLQRSDRILPDADLELSQELRKCLEEEGIEIHTGVEILAIESASVGATVCVRSRGDVRSFSAESLFLGLGQEPNLRSLNLSSAGITSENGSLVRTPDLRTSVSHIFAIGDVQGENQLATVAGHEGAVAAENALSGKHEITDYTWIPRAVFTSPEAAWSGLTEAQAATTGKKIQIGKAAFSQVPRAWTHGDTRGFVKLIVSAGTGEILGASILGHQAGDLIEEVVIAARAGATADLLRKSIHVYPTFAEGIRMAAQALNMDISKLSCCGE